MSKRPHPKRLGSSSTTRDSCRGGVLTVDGRRPTVLSTDDIEYFEAQFFLAPSSGTVYVDAALSLVRIACGRPNSLNVRSKTVNANFSCVVESASHVRR